MAPKKQKQKPPKHEVLLVSKAERKSLSGLKNTRQILGRAKYNKWLFAGIIVLYCMMIALDVLDALIAKEILFNITESAWERMAKFALFYFAIALVYRVLNYLQSYATTVFNFQITKSLKLDAYNRVNSLSATCFSNNITSTYISRINESNALSTIFVNFLSHIHKIISALAYCLVFVTTTPILFCILAVFYIFRAVAMEFVIPKHQAMRRKNREISERANNIMLESVRGALDIKGLNIEQNFTSSYTQTYNHSIDGAIKIGIWNRNRQHPINMVATEINSLIFMLLSANFALSGTLTAGAILFAWTYRHNVSSFFSNILDVRDYLASIEMSASRYNELYDETKFPIEKFGDKNINVVGNIQFKNVTFYYDKKKPVLSDISLCIPAHKTTAFVGKTGCGKSTTLSLIARFYDPKKGRILIDGKPLKSLSKNCLRSNIAYIQQNPYIFNATFKQNLLFVKPDATDEEIIEACKKSEIHETIMSNEKGYDTLLGENGINLSGGQRQRLAIARAFLSNAKIVMFDESTSSLDNKNQAKIQTAIDSLAKNRTIIVVAHRLSTIINADNIYFIDGNRVLASGTHAQLMQNCKEYADLYKIESENKE